MNNRTNGEGAIYPSSDGSGWIASLDLPRLSDGKRRRSKRRAKTKTEARRHLKQMRSELDQAGGVADVQRTIADAVESYLTVRSGLTLSEGGQEDDKWYTQIVLDGLGHRRAAKLTVVECDEFLRLCSLGLNGRRPIGRGRMTRLRRFLISVLHNELRTGGLIRNVAELTVLPPNGKEKAKQRSLTGEELHQLLHSASGARLVLIDLCGRNGLRPAEARALRWQDVDLDARELNISGQLNRANERTSTKRAHNSNRTILTDQITIQRLEEWQANQETMRESARAAWQENDVIASTALGTPIDRHSFARSIRSLCKRLGLDPPIRPYELRHTAISMQADAGRSSWEIADWAGTSEAMISRVYRHQIRRLSTVRPAQYDGVNGLVL